MYQTILALHSLVRWFVLISLFLSVYRSYKGWLTQKKFTKLDDSIRLWTATIAHIQLILGLWLYFISPIINYFFNNYKEALHHGEIRFFGMEHNFMMLIAILIITIGSSKAKRKQTDLEKFKTIAIWFSIGLSIILISIPWPFSPFAGRPYFRPF